MPDLRYKALLIGNADFPGDPDNLQRLRGPTVDVELLREAITDPDVGLFAADNVKVLADQPKLTIAAELERFFTGATRDDRLFLYYSGHGLLDQRNVLHLCAHDTQTDILKASSVSATEINAMFDASAAQATVIVLDCCHSGAFKSGDIQASLAGEGRFLLTSCRQDELAADADLDSGSSIFTKHLVEGLRSGAADRNQDGYVSLNELYDYVHEQLLQESKQIPQRRFSGGGDPPIAARDAHAQLLEAPPIDGDGVGPGSDVASPTWVKTGEAAAAAGAVLAAGAAFLKWRNRRRAAKRDADSSTVAIQNVYNLPRERAGTILSNQGFDVSTVEVGSGSVAAGRVRRVLCTVDGHDVTLVDENGVYPEGENLDPGTSVVLEVSTGNRD